MRMVGNEVYIQRGENFTLDFQVADELGNPFVVYNEWRHPYLAITITAARYPQDGDMRRTYWLDLSKRWVADVNGTLTEENLKSFVSTQPLYMPTYPFTVEDIAAYYGSFVNTEDSDDPFYYTNYLFFTDTNANGERKFVYGVSERQITIEGETFRQVICAQYDFRVVTSFNTRDWYEQTYLYDIKVLAGQSTGEFIVASLLNYDSQYDFGDATSNPANWTREDYQAFINDIQDEEDKATAQMLFDNNIPLTSTYDTKKIILPATNIYVSANIQGEY